MMWEEVNRFQSGIARQLLSWSLGISLLPLLILMFVMGVTSNRVLNHKALENVRALAAIEADRFETCVVERRANIDSLAHLPEVATALVRLTQYFSQSRVASPEWVTIESETREVLGEVLKPYGYADLFLVSPGGDEVFSLNRLGEQETNYLTGPYRDTELARAFERARMQTESILSGFAPFPRSNSPAAFVASSVFKDEVLLGVLVLQISPDQIFSDVQHYTGLGKTGEIVVASRVGDEILFLAPTRHDPEAAFRRTMPPAHPAAHRLKQAVGGHEGSGSGVDYRGFQTIAAWRYLPSWNWGMVVKIDSEEVFAPLEWGMRWGILAGLITLAFVGTMAFRGAASVTGPIVNLTHAARLMAAGDLTQKVTVASADEIGELEQAFNKMAADLRTIYATIEDQVRKRTRQQEVVAELGTKALSCGDLTPLLDHAVSLLANTLQIEMVKVLELLPDGHEFLLRAGTGWNEGLIGHATVSGSLDSFCGYLLSSNEPLIVKDLQKDSRFRASALLHEHGAVSGAGCLIPGVDQPYGILGVFAAQTRSFSEHDIHFLQAMAHVLAAAIERQKGEDALRRASLYNRSLIEASLDPLVTIGRDGKIMDVNATTEAVTGYPRQELIGRDFVNYFTDPEKARKGYEVAFQKGSVRELALEIQRKDGHVTPVLYNAAVYHDETGQVMGVCAAARDFTDHKLAEALEHSNKELEQFAYIASHDLQEPLRMVASYVELFAQRYQGQVDEKADKYIHYIVDGASRMQTLINDLLTYSRVATRALPFTMTSAETTLVQVLNNLQVAIAEKGAIVTHDPLPDVVVDPTQFMQVLQNLIANALKFCQQKPLVHISAVRQGDEWLFSVRDNGIGIAPEHIPRLFVIFQRLHTRSEYPGTGIGLAVCRKAVERRGGRIWIESVPGQGSTFFFTIPLLEE